MTAKECIANGRAVLGIELGSTRIKAVLNDENNKPIKYFFTADAELDADDIKLDIQYGALCSGSQICNTSSHECTTPLIGK